MSTLPRVLCPPGQWTDVSAGMVVGKAYTLQNRNNAPFWMCEKSTEPVDGDSLFAVDSLEFVHVTYASVSFYVKPVDGKTISVDIQEAQ